MLAFDGEAPMEPMVRRIGHVAVVDLPGNITIGQGHVVLRETICGLLEQCQQYILLNLAKVFYMDSCGIVELVACSARARDQSTTIKLLGPSLRVCDLLELTKLDEVFETFWDEEEALASFSMDRAAVKVAGPLQRCSSAPGCCGEESHMAETKSGTLRST